MEENQGFYHEGEEEMSFTIAKMLQLPAFRDASVLAGGKGVNATLDGVTILESTDFHNAVMKGKLVLTSAFFLDLFRESGVNYVLECYKRHAVALCVKEGAAEQSLPDVSNIIMVAMYDCLPAKVRKMGGAAKSNQCLVRGGGGEGVRRGWPAAGSRVRVLNLV